MPALAAIGINGLIDAQGNGHGGAGRAKAAVTVANQAMVPSHWLGNTHHLPHEAAGNSCERVAGRDRVVVAPPHFQKARLPAAVHAVQRWSAAWCGWQPACGTAKDRWSHLRRSDTYLAVFSCGTGVLACRPFVLEYRPDACSTRKLTRLESLPDSGERSFAHWKLI